MSFSEFLSKIYEVVGCDSQYFELKMRMRYQKHNSYVDVGLNDDSSLRNKWVAVRQNSMSNMQLYLEMVPKKASVLDNMGSFPSIHSLSGMYSNSPGRIPNQGRGSFTRMLTDEHYTVDHFLDVTSPTPSPDIEVDPHVPDSWRTWSGNNKYSLHGELKVGLEFDTLQQLKEAVKLYSITKNQTFRLKEVTPEKYVVECIRKEKCKCPWRLHAINLPALPTFKIVKYKGPHASTCVGELNKIDHPLLSSEFVCGVILDLIQADPSLKVCAIVQVIKDRFPYTITYKRAWSAKQKAITTIFGDWYKSYEELPKFTQALRESNEGTMVHWRTTTTLNPSTRVFQRVFWAFKPSIDGFNHFRPLITIGTHLYGKYKGTLLISMATNANFQLFPLAFAVVEGETGDAWEWFMLCIRQSITKREGICAVSYQIGMPRY